MYVVYMFVGFRIFCPHRPPGTLLMITCTHPPSPKDIPVWPKNPPLPASLQSLRTELTISTIALRVQTGHQFVADLVKGFVAERALEGLLSGVREPVTLVVALLVESFAADLADERLDALVYASVSVER